MERKGKRLGRGAVIVLIAILAVMLVVVLSSTALAGEKQYKFDPSKFDLSKFDHRINWSAIGWCNFDFSKIDWKHFDITSLTTDTTEEGAESTVLINTGGGGTTGGPGAGTWALGFFALALAGGLGWTAVRPALKRK